MKGFIYALPMLVGFVIDIFVGDPYNFPHPIRATISAQHTPMAIFLPLPDLCERCDEYCGFEREYCDAPA